MGRDLHSRGQARRAALITLEVRPWRSRASIRTGTTPARYDNTWIIAQPCRHCAQVRLGVGGFPTISSKFTGSLEFLTSSISPANRGSSPTMQQSGKGKSGRMKDCRRLRLVGAMEGGFSSTKNGDEEMIRCHWEVDQVTIGTIKLRSASTADLDTTFQTPEAWSPMETRSVI